MPKITMLPNSLPDLLDLDTVVLDAYVDASLLAIQNADAKTFDAIKARFGKKGELAKLSAQMGKLDAEQKKHFGELLHRARNAISDALAQKTQALDAQALMQKLSAERIDIGLEIPSKGAIHPVMLVQRQMEDFFIRQGFGVANGPEIEDDLHNFSALNIADNHPARAMHDTFYIDPVHLLRTHTSPVQVRTMRQSAPPIAVVCAGRVYRCDSDQTHSPMFHQMEGLWVGEHTDFASLRGLMFAFLQDFFGKDVKVRFRPSFFPFTEPSAEVDILSHNGRWLEVLGCGMVHPNVLDMAGIDSKRYQGFAFGMGIERMAMLKFGIDDLRLFFQNDVRFLAQFGGLV